MTEAEPVRQKRGYVSGDGLSGGFWRRVLAYWIDHALVGLALSLIGAAAFPLTNGLIRHSSPIIVFGYCTPLDAANSRNIDRLPDARAGGPMSLVRPSRRPDSLQVARCDVSLLGVPTHAAVRASRFWRGRFTYHETMAFPLRPAGQAMTKTLDLGTLFFPVLIVWLTACEGLRGAGPGKALMGLRVIRRDGVSRAGLGAALRRNLVQYGPMAVLGLFVVATGVSKTMPGGVLFDPALGWGLVSLAIVTAAWGLVLLGGVLFQRPDPFWDRWSDVSVRRRVWIEQT